MFGERHTVAGLQRVDDTNAATSPKSISLGFDHGTALRQVLRDRRDHQGTDDDARQPVLESTMRDPPSATADAPPSSATAGAS